MCAVEGSGEQLEGCDSTGEVAEFFPFSKEGVCAAIKGLLDKMVLVGSGQNEDGNVRKFGMFANPTQERHAATVRVRQV